VALTVTCASADIVVKQAAGDIRVEDFAGVLVLQFVQTATPATIAQGLPL
jgi:hypothetical protein